MSEDVKQKSVGMSGGVVLVSSHSPTTAAVRAALGEGGELSSEQVCTDLTQLLLCLQRRPVSVAVVDLDPDPLQTLQALEPIIARFSQTRFVVLTQTERADLLREAMNIGARYCLGKEAIADRLGEVLSRIHRSSNGAARSLGEVVTVLSAGGGCGASTLAINLGHELQLATQKPTMLMDLDWHYGAIADYLGLQSQFGLGDIIGGQGPIDTDLVRSTARMYSDRLMALLSPASTDPENVAPMDIDRLTTAVAICQMAYPYTVIDAPRQTPEAMGGLASLSRLTLIVFQLCVKDVRQARTILTGLKRRGIPRERVVLVANRYRRRRQWISLDEASEGLGGEPIEWITNDFAAAARSGNFGQPIEEVARRSWIRKDLQRVMAPLVKAKAE